MEFWRKLKTLMGSTTTHSPYLSDSQGNKHFKDTEKEVIHYNYWNNIFQITEHENQLFDEETDERVMEELEAHTDTLNTDPIINLENLRIDDPLISPITTDETVNVIIRIKNKSPGTNQIIKTDLTNLPLMMIQRLTAIFNASLTCGYFPKKFKQALITLIPKAGKPNRPENFRPISLLNIPGKILEKIINNRLKAHLENNLLLNTQQYGFRESRGTTTTIALAYEVALVLANINSRM